MSQYQEIQVDHSIIDSIRNRAKQHIATMAIMEPCVEFWEMAEVVNKQINLIGELEATR